MIRLTNNSILFGLIGMIIMFFLLEVRNKCFIKDNSTELLNKNIKVLVRQASRWTTAATQDKSPLVAVLHANYGAGYLWALKDIATGEQVRSASGVDMVKFEDEIIKVQDNVTTKLAKLCPKYAPEPSYLSKIAKEG